jgi:tetratricopeptide (TPR) repeat protein
MDKRILRWDSEKFPLKIYVENNIDVPSYYNEEIYKAFSQWQSSTQFIKFANTKNIKDASIVVTIKPLPNDICKDDVCRYVVGFTTPEIKGEILKTMNIVLYSKDPHGNYFSDKEIYNTILHEIGHALGIMGHSYSSDDLMYMASDNNNFYTPYRSSFQYLSSKDINTIRLLYKIIPDITNNNSINTKGLIYAPVVLGTSKDIYSRKLKEAQNYVKNAPDLSGGYIDLGIAYAELNKTHEAIKALQKAYELSKTDNERYTSLYNLSAVYLNSGDTNNALKYANDAKNIADSDEIKELISNINHAKVTKSKPFKL